MSAIEKTQKLERRNISLSLLVPSEYNPNKMSKRQFNLLCDNLDRTGVTDPVLVRPLSDGRFKIVGGHHRYEAMLLKDFEDAPCTIIIDPDFDEDAEKYQLVRMNMIRGQLDANKFLALYQSMDKKYESEVMAEAFGFTDENLFKALIGQMSVSLPKAAQSEFKKAAEEIKTIEGLSKLLNQMFSKYGQTLPYGYMLLDFGGKDSVWIRLQPYDRQKFLAVAAKCAERKRSVDGLFRLFLQSIADGKYPEMLQALDSFPEVVVPDNGIPLEG